jgi:hypothetical protein
MNERRLYYLSIAFALVGLLALLFLPNPSQSLYSAEQDCGYNEFEIKGKITAIQEKASIGILHVEQNVTIIAFQNISQMAGKNAKITATFSKYKGKQEIIANEIKLY